MLGRRKRSRKAVWLSALALCMTCHLPVLLAAGGILASVGAVTTQGGPWLAAGAGVIAPVLIALVYTAVRRARRMVLR